MDLIVIGSISEDIIIEANNLPGINEECFGESYDNINGGGGANVAYLVSSLFNIDTYLLSCVGSDEVGKRLLSNVSKTKILDTYLKTIPNTRSTKHIIVLDKNDNRVTYVYSGAMSKLNFNLFPKDFIKKHKNVYLAPTIPETALELVELLRETNISLFFNPGSAFFYNKNDFHSVLAITDTLILNDNEARYYSNKNNVMNAANYFLDNGVIRVAITLGENGAITSTKNTHNRISSYKVATESTVGCGDAFAAGYVGAIIHGNSNQDAMVFGNAVGAFVASKKRKSMKLPLKNDIVKIIESECFRKETGFEN